MQLLRMLFILSFTIAFGLQAQNPNIGSYKLTDFSIEFSGVETPYTVASLFSLPEQKVNVKVKSKSNNNDFIIYASAGIFYPISKDEWTWELPDSTGHYKLQMIETNSKQKFRLNTFVVFPYTEKKGKTINNFEVGNYPQSGEEIYDEPIGFIEVKPEMTELYLSPHFQVKDFLCKQECDYPMYLVLQEKLMIKLEKIHERLKQKGFKVRNMEIMSGYRTPFYNEAIGNVKFSRHQFGDAADIFIDNNYDHYMDDLNKDGKTNVQDVEVLYQTILEMTKEEWFKPYIGGLGFYKPNAHRTGFVHVDVRGNPARWGH